MLLQTRFKKEENWKIVLPRILLMPTIKWFHIVTGHPGEKRLELTLRSIFFYPELRHLVKKLSVIFAKDTNYPGKGMVYYLKGILLQSHFKKLL